MFKTKPTPPQLEEETYQFYVAYSEETVYLETILEHIKKVHGNPSTARITRIDDEWHDTECFYKITITYQESPESPNFKLRLEKHEEALAMYEFWYSRNKEVADAAEVAEAECLRVKATKELEGKIRAQEWKVTRAQQELKVLQEQMNKRLI